MESEAEYNYCKEFKDISIGFYDDGFPHYNGYNDTDEKIYSDRIKELTEKLTLEVENNLLELLNSKGKQLAYLQRILKKAEVVWDKLDWYYEDTMQCEEQVFKDGKWEWQFGFQYRLWWHQSKLNDDLCDFLRIRINELNDALTEKKKKGRKAIESEKIVWIESTHYLRKLHFALSSDFLDHQRKNQRRYISRISFEEFQKHFIPHTEIPKEKMNWEKEKYMLVLLFDELARKDFFEKNFITNSSKLLSIHFEHRGNPITSQQITSSRNTFLHKTNKLTDKKNHKLYFLQELVNQLSKLKKKPVTKKR